MERLEPIIETSLLEESEHLHYILHNRGILTTESLEREIIDWVNGLLRAAAENEPGLVRLLPYPARSEENV